MGSVVDDVAPVSYALYPVQRSRRILRRVLVGGAAALVLSAAAGGGYLLRAHRASAASVAVASAPVVRPAVAHEPQLGAPAAPELGPVAVKEAQKRESPPAVSVEPAVVKAAPRLARPAAVARPQPKKVTKAAASPKHELSDAALQKILAGE